MSTENPTPGSIEDMLERGMTRDQIVAALAEQQAIPPEAAAAWLEAHLSGQVRDDIGGEGDEN